MQTKEGVKQKLLVQRGSCYEILYFIYFNTFFRLYILLFLYTIRVTVAISEIKAPTLVCVFVFCFLAELRGG